MCAVIIWVYYRLHDGGSKFPKLGECAHFHYDFTELSVIQVRFTHTGLTIKRSAGVAPQVIHSYSNDNHVDYNLTQYA